MSTIADFEPEIEEVEDRPVRNANGSNGANAAPRKPRRRRGILLILLAFFLIVGGTVAVLYALHARHFESTDDAFVDGPIVPISPQVAGQVSKVYVSDNAEVHAGDRLVDLDTTLYDVALEQAKAAREAAEGRLKQAQSQIESVHANQAEARAELAVAQANASSAHSDLSRYQELSTKTPQAVSRQQVDTAVSSQQAADAQVAQAKAKVTAADAQLATAQAAIEAAKGDVNRADADIRKATTDRDYCYIKAPQAGRITRKNVEAGAYVQVGQPLFALVSHDVWVTANFKETQLDQMRPGQPVTIGIDAYPDKRFTGKIDSVQAGTGARFSMLPVENATGNFVKVVQRVPVKIVFDDPNEMNDVHTLLAPGMSATPEVKVR